MQDWEEYWSFRMAESVQQSVDWGGLAIKRLSKSGDQLA